MNILNSVRKALSILLFSLIVIFNGCKKSGWYDQQPYKSQSVPRSLNDLQEIMDNALVLNTYSPSLGEIGSDGHHVNNDFFSYLTSADINANTWSLREPYQNVYEWNNSNVSGGYPRVYCSNLVIETLNTIIPENSLDKISHDYILGQALFHRARTFFELAQVFSPPYIVESSASELSIPLRLSSEISTPSKRSFVKEVYEQILNDLKLALIYLPKDIKPISNLNKARPTRAAVYGFLSRVFLSMEEYSSSKLYADSCLSEYDVLLDFSTVTNTEQPFQMFNAEVIWHSSISDQYYSLLPPFLTIDNSLFQQFEINDLRKYLFFTDDGAGSVYFKGQYTGSYSLFSGLATDEVILNKAECLARENNSTEAMMTLNHLLKNRWSKINGSSTFVDLNANDATSALTLILKERKKELLLRGLRWSDLRRLNRDPRFKVVIERETPLGKFTLEPLSYKYTFPLPDDVIKITGMEQNKGWE